MLNKHDHPGLLSKTIYLILALLCILIGIVGLVMPIIPGVLFLFCAAYLLGKISSRFKNWCESQPAFRKMYLNHKQSGQTKWSTQIKVYALMSLTAMVGTVALLGRAIRRLFPSRPFRFANSTGRRG